VVGALLCWLAILAAQEQKPERGAKPQAPLTPAQLAERAVHRRAVEAVIWGMPAVNYERMLQAAFAAKAGPNQIVYWSRPLDWKNQTLTPNPDTIYFMPFYDTTDGPIVLEIPPADGASTVTGSIDDAWQNALEDVGPAGADKGNGGKYLITPPGYSEKVPERYMVLPSSTCRGFALVRSNLRSASDDDVARAVAYGKRMKFYPLAKPGQKTAYIDAFGVMFDATIPYNARYFELLHRFMQAEPWLPRDKVMIDVLKTLGIEKGKPFNPDAKARTILDDAAREARAFIEMQYEALFVPPFNEGTHWAVPASKEVVEGLSTGFADANVYPVDARGTTYAMGYFSAKHLGAGQFYLMAFKDKADRPLDGKKTYRLTVPPKAPVTLYWSATAYNRNTHALIRDTSRSSRASNSPAVQQHADGSVDVYFGPKAPEGKEANWVPTDAKGQFEVLFRFYGPEKPLFDKTWKLPDIEEVK
jgi:hypothetical protein